jgi:uncharacterized protein (DUF927 family)
MCLVCNDSACVGFPASLSRFPTYSNDKAATRWASLRSHQQHADNTREHVYVEHTERLDQVFNTIASYLGGPGFKSRLEDRLS